MGLVSAEGRLLRSCAGALARRWHTTMTDLDSLKLELRQFARERDWEQFHSPKNLAMALAGEAGELLEVFQWLTEAESGDLRESQLKKAEEEIADVQIYLVRLADRLGVDLLAACTAKLDLNRTKYPADSDRGSAKKYSEYE